MTKLIPITWCGFVLLTLLVVELTACCERSPEDANRLPFKEEFRIKKQLHAQAIQFCPDGIIRRYDKPANFRKYQLLRIPVGYDQPPAIFAYNGRRLLRITGAPESLCEVLSSERLSVEQYDLRSLEYLILETVDPPTTTSAIAVVNSIDDLIDYASNSSKYDLSYRSNLTPVELDRLKAGCQGHISRSALQNLSNDTHLRFIGLYRSAPLNKGNGIVTVAEFVLHITPQYKAELKVDTIFSEELVR
jgi:hypothetical protein